MAQLNDNERITLLMMIGFGERRRSLQEASDLFNDTFPERNPISKSTACRILHNFEHTGNVKNLPKTGRPKTATNDDRALDVLLAIQEEPKTSIPKLSLETGNSERSVRRILRRNKIHPYKVSLLQELAEDDPDRRMQFCQQIMNFLDETPQFVDRILFSDEATFCLNGFVNRHNCRYWSAENPHWMEEMHTQHPQKVNVWAGIIGTHVIGPFFLNGNLTADTYLTLLREKVIPAVIQIFPNRENPQVIANDVYFQQDGAPPHYARIVRVFLDNVFPRRWIGRRGHIEWPARSPDLTPLDFFFWGHLKSVVYRTKPATVQELQERILAVADNITPQSLQNVQQEFVDRLAHCQAVEGFQFEHLIK